MTESAGSQESPQTVRDSFRGRRVPDWRFVYFIAAEEVGMVKIGVADDPEKRRRMLQVGSPSRLTILGVMETDDAPALERDLHKAFAAYRAHGEWFTLDQTIRDYIAARSPELPAGCSIGFMRKPPAEQVVAFRVARRARESIRSFVGRVCDSARAAGFVVEP